MIHPSDSSLNSSPQPSSPQQWADPQEGVTPLTPSQQQEHLSEFFEDHYPEILWHLQSDNLHLVREQLEELSEDQRAERVGEVEGYWSRLPDLLSHSSLLVLGAGLDHRMPGVAFSGASAEEIRIEDFPEPVTIIHPSQSTGAIALGFRGGAPWFGHHQAREQFWLPLWGAIAELSGVTIVDVNYSESWWDKPALHNSFLSWLHNYDVWTVQEEHGEGQEGNNKKEQKRIGIISVGCGYDCAQKYYPWAAWAVHLSPDTFAIHTPDITSESHLPADIPQLLSLEAQEVQTYQPHGEHSQEHPWDKFQGEEVSFYSYPIKNHIGAPAVWRQRIEDIASWIKKIG